MAKLFTLDEYRCVDPPEKLWRVTHGNSQSRWDHEGLIAADGSRVFHDEVELKEAIQHHIDWWINWAAQREKRDPPAYIHEIDTTYLPLGVEILDMELLMIKLDIENPYSAHELLFLHCIPARCIVRSRTVLGTQDDTRPAYGAGWPGGIDLDDGSDSEESAEEHNRNDDLLKMMEGLWE
ncbi:hypothetical protein B0I37DRAFT_399030 [Chaetomium sp. MPI-CAGE-AT-0009]|nr:hypothetical protein B0I37DRAFT_399030 [Chaetomium sp. MPI-CAGE-AT-0009]